MPSSLANYAQILRGYNRFVSTPPIANAAAAVRERFARREADFIAMVRHVVFGNPANPYHALFRAAGCEVGDLERGIRRDGLEATLRALRENGVYLAHEEFKGRRPIVRHRLEIQARPDVFANPAVDSLMETTSSGSTGQPVRSRKGLARMLYNEACQRLVYQAYGLQRAAYLELKTTLPGTTGVNSVLRRERMGLAPGAWHCAGRSWRRDGRFRLATHVLLLMVRARGLRPPWPVYLDDGDFLTPARWIAARRREGRPCVVGGMVSSVTRLAAAALEEGLDIGGTVSQTGGEPLTDAKQALLRRAGMQPMNGYWISELGLIGFSCPAMDDASAVHHFSEATAIVTMRREVPGADRPVDSLLFTTLLPFTPLLLINVEMDDTAAVDTSPCGCALSRLGWTSRLRGIHSFGKLTGQGMTLVGSDVVRILESLLPARFGGLPGDFQLAERDGDGQTELDLLVSPRVPAARPGEIREAFFEELRQREGGLQAERIWRHSQTLRIVRAEPVATASGKVLPLRLLTASEARTRAS